MMKTQKNRMGIPPISTLMLILILSLFWGCSEDNSLAPELDDKSAVGEHNHAAGENCVETRSGSRGRPEEGVFEPITNQYYWRDRVHDCVNWVDRRHNCDQKKRWVDRRHDCTRWVDRRHDCTRLVTVKKKIEWGGYWKTYPWPKPWKWVKKYKTIYVDEWQTHKNKISCGLSGWPHRELQTHSIISCGQSGWPHEELQSPYIISCGHEGWPHREMQTRKGQVKCGQSGWPHQEYLRNIDPKFKLSELRRDGSFSTKSRGDAYCWNGWGSWGFHGDDEASNAWFGDFRCSHAPGSHAVCYDMTSTSYVKRKDGVIVKGKDLTADLVKEYGMGARRVQLWMGDYGGAWGSGAEICYYKLVPSNVGYWNGKGTFVKPGAKWAPDMDGTYMEYKVVDKHNNRVLLSCSKNRISNVHKTWWLNTWAPAGAPRRIMSGDMDMYFRVKSFWGNTWKRWDGKHPGAHIKDVF